MTTEELLSGYKDQLERGVIRGELIGFEFYPTDRSLDKVIMLGEIETPIKYV